MDSDKPYPGFLIIGAQKCGTSWLHRHLRSHEALYLPAQKDQDFFSYEAHLESPGLAAYRQQFAAAGSRLAGEASASYFWTWDEDDWCRMPPGFQRDIPGAVRRSLGSELKFIIMLRDPLERALSAYAHYLAHGEVDPATPFEEAAHYGGIVHMGFYQRHWNRWSSRFPAEQFHLLTLEQVRENPRAALDSVTRFLGVDRLSLTDDALAEPVFPGLPQHLTTSGDRIIELPGHAVDSGHVRVSQASLQLLETCFSENEGWLSMARKAGCSIL